MNRLLELRNRIGSPRIVVLGDIMLDRYTSGNAERISPEAPIVVLAADSDEVRLGGAASVAGLLRHLEAQVSLAGVIGDDSDGRIVEALLKEAGIDHSMVHVDNSRPTTSKHRFFGRSGGRTAQPVLRVDRETSQTLSPFYEDRLQGDLIASLSDADVLLVSDYNKGVCSPHLLRTVIDAARDRGKPVLVDPARTTDYGRYRGADVILPNRTEAELVCGKRLDCAQGAIEAGEQLCQEFDFPAVLLKLDRDGIAVIESHQSPGILIPTKARHVFDVTGAGDMVLAISGLAYAAGLSLRETATLANIAAGLEVEKLGVAPISWSEIIGNGGTSRGMTDKIVQLDHLVQLTESYRREGRTVVFTNGCFDLLHIGHITYLQQAAQLGELLIVAINSDASVRRLKGPSRPIVPEQDRAAMLAALSCVDYVLIFDDDTPHKLLESIRPGILVKGGTYTVDGVLGREVVQAYGGQVCVVDAVPGVSTTNLIVAMGKRHACDTL